jgi:nucleotide-binding universal stress UspA family protein
LKIAVDRSISGVSAGVNVTSLLGDLILGSVANGVRHRTDISVLLVRARKT